MAYKVNPPNTNPSDATAGGPVTMTDVENFFAGNESPEFYELETAEVVEIYLDENDLPLNKDGDPDWLKYGWAKVRMSVSSKRDTDIVEAQPLNSNIKEYPLPGEFVIVADKYLGGRYYTQKINANNSVNFNYLPGFSTPDSTMQTITNQTIENFKPDSRIRELQAEEGDITFNGRFGQSIRFGSNIVKLGGNKYGPNILIRAGQGAILDTKRSTEFLTKGDRIDIPFKPIKEDINLDGSSIWMTTDQQVSLHLKGHDPWQSGAFSVTSGQKVWPFYHMRELGVSKNSSRKFREGGYSGNNIILNSDRLIFNTKKNAILMSSPTMIGLSADIEIGLEVPNRPGCRVMLGDAGRNRKSNIRPEDIEGIQPVLGGDQTMKLFANLIDSISEFAGILTTAVAGPGLPWAPTTLTPINAAASQLRASLSALKLRLDEPKSKTVFVGHIKGPSPLTSPKKLKKPNREIETAAWIKAAREGENIIGDGLNLFFPNYPDTTDASSKTYHDFMVSLGEGGEAAGHPGINIEKLEDPKIPSGMKTVGFTETIFQPPYNVTWSSGISATQTVITSHPQVEVTTFHDHIMSLYVEEDDGRPSWPK